MIKSQFLTAVTRYLDEKKIPWQYADKVNGRLIKVKNSEKKWKFFGAAPFSFWSVNSQISSSITKDKDLTIRICRENGLNAPYSETGVYNPNLYPDDLKKEIKSVNAVAKNFKFKNMVIKPNYSSSAKGLSFIYNRHYVNDAIDLAGKHSNVILFQEILYGSDARYLVFKGKPLLKIKRKPSTKTIFSNKKESEISKKSYELSVKAGNKLKIENPYPVINYAVTRENGKLSDVFNKEEKIMAQKIYQLFDLKFFAIDCIVNDKIYILEINSNPGIDSESKDPKENILTQKYFKKIIDLNLES